MDVMYTVVSSLAISGYSKNLKAPCKHHVCVSLRPMEVTKSIAMPSSLEEMQATESVALRLTRNKSLAPVDLGLKGDQN